MFRVKLSNLAQEDLISIWEYLNEIAGGEIADQMLYRINARVDSLADFPERGALQDDLKTEVRKLIEGKYLIYYSPYIETVLILRIIHGARDLTELDFS